MLTRQKYPAQLPVKLSGGETIEELRSDVQILRDQLTDLNKTLTQWFVRLNAPGAMTITQTRLSNCTIEDSTIGATTASTGAFSSLTFTGTLKGANGTAAAPAYSFSSSGNDDNGMYLPAANTLGWTTAGTLRMTLNGTGLGVGITPTQKFHTSVADNAIAGLFAGASKGARIRATSSGMQIEGVDQTGAGSYQPLYIGGSQIQFTASNSEKARITANGEMLVGVTSANANGGCLQLKSGITFPATAVAATDANTLDDYDENTWTPTDGSGAGLSFTAAIGSYTKIGRIVIAQCTVIYPTTADGSNAVIGGLPFTVGSSNAAGATYTTCATATTVFAYATTTLVGLVNAAGAAAITNAQMTGKTIAFTVTYET